MSSKRKRKLKRRVLSIVVKGFTWVGAMILYYLLFSIYFDTPIEHEIRNANSTLKQQYTSISSKLDSLSVVMDNASERDKNVYGMLFESDPSANKSIIDSTELIDKEMLIQLSNRDLADLFFERVNSFEEEVENGTSDSQRLQEMMVGLGDKVEHIPSIQPVANNEFTKFAASYGMRIQPFFKGIIPHEGVDFAVPENSRIYATADGEVRSVGNGTKGEGLTIVINHGNNYATSYSHLDKALVSRGNRVKRGDIIAYSGNSGLSFLPHLHYTVSYKGDKIDPLHYFYYELTPKQYKELKDLAQLLMQSLD